LQNPDGQSCSSTSSGVGPVTTTCTTTPGGSESIFVAAASLEVAAVLRLTRTFNLLADPVMGLAQNPIPPAQ
jgi:hypothetical protein